MRNPLDIKHALELRFARAGRSRPVAHHHYYPATDTIRVGDYREQALAPIATTVRTDYVRSRNQVLAISTVTVISAQVEKTLDKSDKAIRRSRPHADRNRGIEKNWRRK